MAYFSSDGDEIARISPTYVSPEVWRDPPDAMPGQEYDYMDGFPGDTLIAGDYGATMDGRWGATLIGGASGDTMTRGGLMEGNGGDDDMSEGDDMHGGDGNDRLTDGYNMYGDNGDDTLIAEIPGRYSVLVGGPGDDYLQGGIYLEGDEGNDTLIGGDGHIILDGGDGNDILQAGSDANSLYGGAGDDLYLVDYLDDGEDRPITEAANGGYDTVRSTASFILPDNVERLTLIGPYALDGTGNDSNNLIEGNDLDNRLYGMTGADKLLGGDGNDHLDGGRGGDVLNGGPGDDVLDGGQGADDMGGGLGSDLYIVDNVGDIAEESNGDGAVDTVQASVSYTLSKNIENLTLTGRTAIDGTGNARANVIQGNGQANVLAGKGGADTLTGGGGADTFQFDTPLVAGVVTTITDMTHGIDKIALDHAVFAQAGPLGRLDSSAFWVGTAAHDSSDRIIYNITTGDLSYDPDGGKAQPGTVFAHVAPGLALNAGDFKVV